MQFQPDCLLSSNTIWPCTATQGLLWTAIICTFISVHSATKRSNLKLNYATQEQREAKSYLFTLAFEVRIIFLLKNFCNWTLFLACYTCSNCKVIVNFIRIVHLRNNSGSLESHSVHKKWCWLCWFYQKYQPCIN